MRDRAWLRTVTGEALGSALLVAVMFGSGAVRVQLDLGGLFTSLGGAVLGAVLAAVLARFLFPRAQEAASSLLFVPQGRRR